MNLMRSLFLLVLIPLAGCTLLHRFANRFHQQPAAAAQHKVKPAPPPAILAQSNEDTERLHQFEFVQPKMGTVFRIVMYAEDRDVAERAAAAAWNRVDHLNQVLSDYNPSSELNLLCRQTNEHAMYEPAQVSDDLFRVLEYSLQASILSDGAFDVTVGPLTRLQRGSRQTEQLPTTQQLQEAKQNVGWRYIRLDSLNRSVQLRHEHMQLDVGGIAKGYTADEILKVLRSFGIRRALAGAAGDIAAGDPPPGRSDWRVAIQSLRDPGKTSDYVEIHNSGISTSGDTYRAAEVEGKRYSHIIDPRTGLGLTDRIGVTTLAPMAVTADWMSTAISVLGPQRGMALVRKVPGSATRIVTIDDQGNERVYESPLFRAHLATTMPATEPTVEAKQPTTEPGSDQPQPATEPAPPATQPATVP